MHRPQDVRLCWLTHRILLVVGEDDHVLAPVVEVLVQVRRQILDVVDAALELAALAKVVDADEQCLPLAGAVGVLERVFAGGAVAELLRGRGWGVRSVGAHVGAATVVGCHACISQSCTVDVARW